MKRKLMILGAAVLMCMGAGAQQNNTLKNLLESKTLMGGTLAYYYNTVFGPLGASLGYSNKTKEVNFYINLGYEF